MLSSTKSDQKLCLTTHNNDCLQTRRSFCRSGVITYLIFSCPLKPIQGSYGSGKTWKKGLFEKNQGKPGKLREFSDHFHNLRENSGNFILPNISDQIGGALRINEASK